MPSKPDPQEQSPDVIAWALVPGQFAGQRAHFGHLGFAFRASAPIGVQRSRFMFPIGRVRSNGFAGR